MATSSDLDVLLDMGFDRERAELAVKKSGGRMSNIRVVDDNSITDS